MGQKVNPINFRLQVNKNWALVGLRPIKKSLQRRFVRIMKSAS